MDTIEGNDRVDVFEEDGMRTTKRTGVYSTVELEWVHKQLLFDDRVEASSETPLVLNFAIKESVLKGKDEWMQLIKDTPFSGSFRRETIVAFLKAKCKTRDSLLQAEAMHGLWELSVNRRHHQEIDDESLSWIVKSLNSDSLEVYVTCFTLLQNVSPVGDKTGGCCDLGTGNC